MQKSEWLSLPEVHKREVEYIVERITQPVIFLLGAGASAVAGLPTMASFLKDEYGEDFIASLERATKYSFNTRNVTEDQMNPTELLKMLFQLASLNSVNVSFDLEVVFDLIHQIQELISDRLKASTQLIRLFQTCINPPSKNFSEFKKFHETRQESLKKWFKDISEAIRRLREKMYDRYLIEQVSDPIVNLWMNYKALLSRCSIDTPVVFTTNYDTVFEALHDHGQMDYELMNGIVTKRQRRIFELKNYLKDNIENPFYLFKMHGSVTWERINDNVFDYYPMRQRIPDTSVPTLGKPFGIVEPVMSKKLLFDSQSSPPFSHMYAIFQQVIQNATTCVSIGLSFRDTGLYELLSKTLNTRNDFKLICVAPEESGVNSEILLDTNKNLRKLETEHKNAVWLKHRFGKQVVSVISKEVMSNNSTN